MYGQGFLKQLIHWKLYMGSVISICVFPYTKEYGRTVYIYTSEYLINCSALTGRFHFYFTVYSLGALFS